MYLALSGARGRSRAAWGLLFAYGILATFVGALLVFTFHIHALSAVGVELHIHDATRSIEDTSSALVAMVVVGASVVVFGMAFALNQMSFRRMAARAERNADPEETGRLVSLCPGAGSLVAVREPEPAAFCFAILGREPGRLRPSAQEYLVLTTGLTRAMDDQMLRAVVEHERAHVVAHDSRYLPVVRAAKRLMFFDPFYRWIEGRLEVEREFAADREAAAKTGDPRALARALLKALEMGVTARNKSCGLVGACDPDVVVRRIEKLLEMEERGPGPGR